MLIIIERKPGDPIDENHLPPIVERGWWYSRLPDSLIVLELGRSRDRTYMVFLNEEVGVEYDENGDAKRCLLNPMMFDEFERKIFHYRPDNKDGNQTSI